MTQNAYIESFNGKFRDKCLNEHWFTSLAQARAVIAHGLTTTMKLGRTAHWSTSRQRNLQQGTEQHRPLLPLRSLFEWDFAGTELARLKGAGHADGERIVKI